MTISSVLNDRAKQAAKADHSDGVEYYARLRDQVDEALASAPRPSGDVAAKLGEIVSRLVDEAMGTCEPENACEKASAYSREVLTRKFTGVLRPYTERIATLEQSLSDERTKFQQWCATTMDDNYESVKRDQARIATLEQERTARDAGAIGDIAAERKRQIEAEGWTPEHDDEHGYGEIARAAAAYAVAGSTPAKDEDEALARTMEQLFPYEPTSQLGPTLSEVLRTIETLWPWNWSWWKPTNRRRNLIKAAALIVAEIERLDRKRP